jgi:hypothetical protein
MALGTASPTTGGTLCPSQHHPRSPATPTPPRCPRARLDFTYQPTVAFADLLHLMPAELRDALKRDMDAWFPEATDEEP